MNASLGGDRYKHDAFISYSTLASGTVGAALERAIETLGRGWDEDRALDVYRDVSDQPASSDLAAELLAHLDGSRYLILIASPDAAKSRWVRAEVRHWLASNGTDRLLLVIADGQLVWVSTGNAFDATSSLPPELLTAFQAQPKWVDLRWTASGFDPLDERFLDNVADLSAVMLGRDKVQLVGEHWNAYRRGLAQRLAESARSALDTSAVTSLLLAIAASELDDCPSTRRSLVAVLEKTSGVRAVLGSDVGVTAIGYEPSTRGRLLLGYEDGSIAAWDPDLAEPPRRSLMGRRCPVTAIASSSDGLCIVAGFDDGQVVIRRADGTTWQRPGNGAPCEVVGINPSGEVVAFVTRGSEVSLATSDAPASAQVARRFIAVTKVRFLDENILYAYDWGEVHSIDTKSFTCTVVQETPMLARPGPIAFTDSGDSWVWTQLDGGGINISSLPAQSGTEDRFILGPRGEIEAVGLSPDGTTVIEVVSGELTTWELVPGPEAVSQRSTSIGSIDDLVVGPRGRWVALRGGGKCEVQTRANRTLCRSVVQWAADVPSVIQGALDVAFNPDDTVVAWISNPGWTDPEVPPIGLYYITLGKTSSLPAASAATLSFTENATLRIVDVDGNPTVWDVTRECPLAEAHLDTHEVALERATPDADPMRGSVRCRVVHDGTGLVATSYSSGVLTLLDIESTADLWTMPCPPCSDLAFDMSGGLLVAVSYRGRLLLIDVAAGEISARLDVQDGPTHRLRFDHCGKRLAVVTPGGPLTLVDTDVTSWRRLASARAGRAMTSGERELFGISRLPRLPDPSDP